MMERSIERQQSAIRRPQNRNEAREEAPIVAADKPTKNGSSQEQAAGGRSKSIEG